VFTRISWHRFFGFCLFLAFWLAVLTGATTRSAAAQDSAGRIFLPFVAANGQNPQEPPPGGPNSETLIEEARQAGEIDDETALLYRVYAAFADSRLPAPYRGDDRNAPTSLALRQAQAKMGELSLATQTVLAPFLRPPLAADSWLELQAPGAVSQSSATNRITWHTTCQTDPNIKVWYQQRHPEDAAAARRICEEVSGAIWPRLVNLFGRPLPNDGGQSNNGGDEQLDLYLVNANTGAVGYIGCDNTPSYILVNRARWSPSTLAEAVMSAFVNGYDSADCMEYMWLYAASRTWAMDYVYPTENEEHSVADDFLNHTDLSLNTYPIMPLEADNNIGDGAYLWLWYATNFVRAAKEIMPAIWQNATDPDSLAVMNGALGASGFEHHWKDFSRLNWNNVPVETYFMTDNLLYSTRTKLDTAVTLGSAADHSYELDGNVRYLAAHTYHFTFDDPGARSVLFINPFHGGEWPTARVQAIYRMAEGPWIVEEWTDKYSKEFCRDLKIERIAELTLVISNHEWKDRTHQLKPAYPPRLNVTNVGCRGWKFEGEATLTSTGAEVHVNEKTTVNATYMREKIGDDSDSHPFIVLRVTEGSGSWTHSGVSYDCTANGSGSFDLTGGVYTVLFLWNHATDHETGTQYTPGIRRYSGFGSEGPEVFSRLMVQYICPAGGSHDTLVYSAHRWFMTETVPTQQANDAGDVIEGAFTTSDDSDGVVTTFAYTWKMTALPPE
jgi:hypothetical protein